MACGFCPCVFGFVLCLFVLAFLKKKKKKERSILGRCYEDATRVTCMSHPRGETTGPLPFVSRHSFTDFFFPLSFFFFSFSYERVVRLGLIQPISDGSGVTPFFRTSLVLVVLLHRRLNTAVLSYSGQGEPYWYDSALVILLFGFGGVGGERRAWP